MINQPQKLRAGGGERRRAHSLALHSPHASENKEHKSSYSTELGKIYSLPELRLDQFNLRRVEVYKIGQLPPTVVVWMREILIGLSIWTLVSSWWHYLEMWWQVQPCERSYVKGGWGGGYSKGLKLHCTSSWLCFVFAIQDMSSQLLVPPILPVVGCHPSLL